MDNQEKLPSLDTQDSRRRQTQIKTYHNMCWIPLYKKKKKKKKKKRKHKPSHKQRCHYICRIGNVYFLAQLFSDSLLFNQILL